MMAVPKRKSHQDDDDSDKRRRQEEALDEALKNTFPASDPVSVVQPMASGHGAGIGFTQVRIGAKGVLVTVMLGSLDGPRLGSASELPQSCARQQRCAQRLCKNGFTKMALEHEQIAQMLERQQEPQTK